jgi:serine/threonine-protein kinase
MGAVYEARHRLTNRRVAVKVILEEARLEPAVVTRFQREARAAGSVESEHITQVLDGGTDATTNAPYLVMELLDGEDLDAVVKRLAPLRPELALRIAAQMLAGLAKAHEAGVVHRDIKPANVFLAKKDDGEIVVKLCDFGIAKVKSDPFATGADQALTRSSTLIGSPIYMSPEQAKGAKDLDARADVWSAGVVLYQLLSGSTPHPGADTLGLLLLAICSEAAPPVSSRAPWVKEEISAIVARALAIEPADRYQTAAEMRDAILALLPDGTKLDKPQFTTMSEDERAFVAPAADPISPAARTLLLDDVPRAEHTKTASPVEVAATAPKKRTWAWAVLGVAVVGGAAIVGQKLGAATSTAPLQPTATSANQAPSATAPASAPQPALAATSSPSATPSASASASAAPSVVLRPIGGPTGVKAAPSTAKSSPTPSARPSTSAPDGIDRNWH